MYIVDYVLREELSSRGGGVEIDLTELGYEDELMSAYQNYLGGGMLGSVGNSCTIANWHSDKDLLEIARQLREYFFERMYEAGCIDEYNEDCDGRLVGYPGL
ncbi:hypothetical protein H6801_03460 [Candidatus Nomurabacteria bacterium]|nr:hypothetical protein [Candidatus Nomurabacteria bacterium]